MRKKLVLPFAALMVLGNVGVMAPASADTSMVPGWPISCLYEISGLPDIQSVYTDSSGRLIVNPEAAPDDAVAYAGWSAGAAGTVGDCILERVPTGPVFCVAGKAAEIGMSLDPVNAYFRYVYPNPNGPGYAIDRPQLESDLAYLSSC